MPSSRRRLPGDPSGRDLVARAIRVDQAGEYGARRIYEGQLAVLGDTPAGAVIREMATAEAEHLQWFDQAMVDREVRPSLLQPLWHVAGYALGAATALLGAPAAMACTVAVEEEIDAHYRRQTARLAADDPALAATIERFHADELRHRDTALAEGAGRAPFYRAMTGSIRAGCRAAIWLAERI